MIVVRRAGALDARPMAELLNAIIRKGGTTAFTEEVSAEQLQSWFLQEPDRSVWHLAEDESGTVMGFQSIEPKDALGDAVCDIATFVRIGSTGMGIGSRLFEQTATAARGLGYRWINATIRADNESGLTYYQSRGFEQYARHKNVALSNGLVVDRISKRYDL